MRTRQNKRPAGGAVWRAALLAVMIAAPIHAADEAAAAVEAKLRDALRGTMLKLRDAQGQVAAAQAAQIAAEDKIKELTAKTESLAKDLISERSTSSNLIAELKTKLDERGTVIAGLEAMLQKWKRSYSEVTAFASKKESERAKLEAKALMLERKAASQQVKNLEMYQAGIETLKRYEKFGLGDAILAREPFVGTTKVKFQNLIQDFGDKLADARIKPGDADPPATTPPTQDAKPPTSKSKG
ncbi:MAG: phage major capsid protein [Verrucomicrobiae bacterium]